MLSKVEIEFWKAGAEAYDNEDFEAALRNFQQVSESAKIHFNLGLVYSEINETSKAASRILNMDTISIEEYTNAIELDNYFAVAYFQRGNAKMILEDDFEALKDYNHTIKLFRDNTCIDYFQLGFSYKIYLCEVMYNRALCHLCIGNTDIARMDLAKAQNLKAKERHNWIDVALDNDGVGCPLFRVPKNIIYRPPVFSIEVTRELQKCKVINGFIIKDKEKEMEERGKEEEKNTIFTRLVRNISIKNNGYEEHIESGLNHLKSTKPMTKLKNSLKRMINKDENDTEKINNIKTKIDKLNEEVSNNLAKMVSETTIVERERGEDFIVLTNNYSTAERTSNEDIANKRNDSKVSLFPNLENNLESLKLSSEDIFQHSFSTNATDNSKLHSIPIFFEYENSLFPNLDVKSSPLNNSIALESLVDAEPESQLDKTNSDYQKKILVLSNSIYSEKCSSIFSSNEGELSSKILHHNIKLPKREHSSTSLKTSFLSNQISEPLHSRAECYKDSPDSLMPEVYGCDSEMVIDSFPASAQQQPDSSDPSNLDNGVKPLYSKPIPAELKNIDYNNFPDFTNTNNPRSIKKLKIKFHYESETYNIVANMDVNFEKLNSLIYEKISNVYSINPKLTHPPSLSDLIFFDFSANQSNDSNFCSSPFSQPNGSQFERHDGSQFHPKNKLKIKFLDEDASLVIMADDDDLNLAKALSCLNPKSGNLHNQVNDIYRQNSSLRRGKSKLSFADKLELWCMF